MGNADITRDQFSAAKNVIRKIGQRDVYIVDADFNEQGQISDYRLTELAYLLAQGKNVRFGPGWAISGGSNQLSITAGKALIQLASGQSYILNQTSSPLNVTGWTTPSGGNRTDILYADISLPIIDVGDDATIVNPAVGTEACVDQRLTYTLVKLQGTVGGGTPSLPTPPAGHYYVAIAQIARTSGQATINSVDITRFLTPWTPLQEIIFWSQTLAATYGYNNNAVAWGATEQTAFGTPTPDSADTWYKKVIVPIWKTASFNRIKVRGMVRRLNLNSLGENYGMTVNGFSRVLGTGTNDSYVYREIVQDVSSAADGADLQTAIELCSADGVNSYLMQQLQVVGYLE